MIVALSSTLLATSLKAQEADADGDGVSDGIDNCIEIANPDQLDLDRDNRGDACDLDRDGDSLSNSIEISLNRNPDVADYKVATGNFINCAIVDKAPGNVSNTIACWDTYDTTSELLDLTSSNYPLPELDGDSRWIGLDGGGGGFCGLAQNLSSGANTLHCFSPKNTSWTSLWTAIPELVEPRLVAVSTNGACAVDEEAIKCWGDASATPLP